MKTFGLLAALASLIFLAACGGGGGPANPGTGSAGFSNASFKGNYVFTMMGQCAGACNSSSVIRSVGSLVSDGNGNITAGSWDVNVGGGDQVLTPVTGTYSVVSDGKLTLNLNAGGNSDSYLVMLTGPTGGYIVSTDTAWALSGVVEQQSAAAIGTQPTGKYVFQTSGLTSGGAAWGLVGAMDLTGGTITADMNKDGTLINMGTGTVVPNSYDNTTGRGLLTVTSATLPSMTFAYYVVDANTIELVSSDASAGMQGRAEVTTGAVASGSVLNGPFAFLGAGFPPSIVSAIAQVSEGGVFTGDGAGNITSGEIDTVYDTNGQVQLSLTGAGHVGTAAGVTRDVLSLTAASGASVPPMSNIILWLTNAGRGFYLTTGAGSATNDRVETGTINAQTGGPYTDNGTFGFYASGFGIQGNSVQAVTFATLFKNANGKVSGYTQALNLLGSPNLNTGTGTFNFDQSNVGQLTLNDTAIGTEDFRIYQYAPGAAFIMEVDQNTIASGLMTVQNSQ